MIDSAPSGPGARAVGTVAAVTRVFAALLAVAAVVVIGLLAGAGTAAAHPTLLFTDPAADSAVAEPPALQTLVFNEPVAIGPDAITVLGSDGLVVPTDRPTSGREGRAVLTRLPEIASGEYRVRWRVTGTDGDLVEGEFGFVVGSAPAGASSARAGAGINWATAVLRWLLLAGLAVGLGGAVADRFTASARAENPRLLPVAPWVVLGSGVAAVGAAGLAALLTATDGWAALGRDRPGQIVLVELAAALLALGVAVRGRYRSSGALLLVVVAAEGVRSHPAVAAPGWGAVVTGVHLVAAAVWVGALVHAARAAWAWRARPPAVRWVVLGYARLALWLLLAVVATGTVSAVLLVPLPALTTTDYGRILLVKLGLVGVAIALAIVGRRALAGPDDRLGRLRRAARAEAGVLVGVLALSATLVSAPPASVAQVAPPPAPVGDVVPVGDLAGQVGVSATASAGQLVVRLSTPRRGDYYGPEEQAEYQLSGSLAYGPGGQPAALDFRDCGNGCFAAPADWRDGDNVLGLQVAATGWAGGAVAARVAWPPQPAGDLLPAVVAAMRAAGEFDAFEAVTSDTRIPLPEPTLLQLDGEFFLAGEPYASGEAPIAVITSRGSGPRRLALGFPAERRHAVLMLDERDRIVEETLVDPKHLVRRHFVYRN
jgi:copper transport protein